jgi:hypothetical protein
MLPSPPGELLEPPTLEPPVFRETLPPTPRLMPLGRTLRELMLPPLMLRAEFEKLPLDIPRGKLMLRDDMLPLMVRADMLPPVLRDMPPLMLRMLIPLPPLNPFWAASAIGCRPTVVVKATATTTSFLTVFLITAPRSPFDGSHCGRTTRRLSVFVERTGRRFVTWRAVE